MKKTSIDQNKLKKLYFRAGWNWLNWRDNFEHLSDERLPALNDPERFKRFVSDYSLLRNYDGAKREEIRNWLNGYKRLARATEHVSGAGIDRLASKLKRTGPCHTREISLVSKLAAFERPDVVFIAYDQFAALGAKKLIEYLNREPNERKSYTDYKGYLADVNTIVISSVGCQIRKYFSTHKPPTQHKKAFLLRMVDCYLMDLGGYET